MIENENNIENKSNDLEDNNSIDNSNDKNKNDIEPSDNINNNNNSKNLKYRLIVKSVEENERE